MKKLLKVIVIGVSIVGALSLSYAGDDEWATAGKVLAIVEGARVITGGNVDVIGNVTGINKNRGWFSGGHSNSARPRPGRQYAKHQTCTSNKTWIPHYTWRKEYIPEHEEYSEKYGKIVVEGHYIQYQIEDGGHWQY